MSDSVLLPIPYWKIDELWSMVEGYIESASQSANGRFTSEDAKKFFKQKDWVLWCSIRNKNIEAIAATEILQYSQKKMCMVRILTGKDYANWVQLEDDIANWAKTIGCDGMEAIARKGWARVFKQYEMSHVFLERMF